MSHSNKQGQSSGAHTPISQGSTSSKKIGLFSPTGGQCKDVAYPYNFKDPTADMQPLSLETSARGGEKLGPQSPLVSNIRRISHAEQDAGRASSASLIGTPLSRLGRLTISAIHEDKCVVSQGSVGDEGDARDGGERHLAVLRNVETADSTQVSLNPSRCSCVCVHL